MNFFSVFRKLNQMFHDTNLHTKVMLVSILPAAICMIVQGTVSFQSAASLMKDQAILFNDRLMIDLNDKVYNYIHDIELKMVVLQNYKDTTYYLQSLESSDINLYDITRQFLQDKFAYNDNVFGLYLYSNSHKLLSSFNPNLVYPPDIMVDGGGNSSESVQQYFDNDSTEPLITSYYNKKINKHVLRIGMKINHNLTGKPLGFILLDMDEANLHKIMKPYEIYENQSLVVYNNREDVLYDNRTYMSGDSLPLNDHTNKTLLSKLNPKFILHFSQELPKYRLVINNDFPLKSIEESQSRMTSTVIYTLFLLGIVVFVLSYILSLTITRPVKKLSEAMEKLEKGDASVRVQLNGKDEIGSLNKSFNTMVRKIDDLITREYKSKLIEDQTKLKALQAQVNPHFLYNTLQVMGNIARSKQVDIVNDMCIALALLFRYSINMEHALASVAEELNHINSYFVIQQVRYLGHLRLRVQCPVQLYDYKIQRMILQPLIENAIEHGLLNKTAKKLIKVKLSLQLDKVCIIIVDNGVGMSSAKLQELKELLINKNEALHRNNSIGLLNVSERIRLLYGDNYSLQLFSKESKGTIIKILIPYNEQIPKLLEGVEQNV